MANTWYVLRTKPHKEVLVEQQVQARGFEVYLPQLPANPVNPRARKFKPFFPGYVFVKTDLKQMGISAFQYMPFTIGLVCFGGEPALIPEALLAAIRQREHELKKADNAATQPYDDFSHGDRVWIQNGPFSGYDAIFDARLSGQERVRVLLNMLNDRHIPVELNARLISKVPV